jgi:hypothetical protein
MGVCTDGRKQWSFDEVLQFESLLVGERIAMHYMDRVTASQMASASVASFFCRLTYGFT